MRILKKRRSLEEHHWFVLEMNQRFPKAFRTLGQKRLNRRPQMTAVELTGVRAGLMTPPEPECGPTSKRGLEKAQAQELCNRQVRNERRSRWREEYLEQHGINLSVLEEDEVQETLTRVRAYIDHREREGKYSSAGIWEDAA